MSDTADLMQAVAAAARVAGGVALGHFRSRLDVETKGDGSPVTIADRAAETAAREWIARRCPLDDIIGEEYGSSTRSARRRWIIDPIDGTRSYIRGVPLWGTLIAVAEGDDVIAGAAFFPALDEMLCAALGEGAWWNDSRCHVSTIARLRDATVLTTDERFTAAPARRPGWESLASAAALSRSWGDCYGYLLVATGRAEAMLDPQLAEWDAAALLPAVREAGGVFTDWSGKATAFGGSAIATNGALAALVRARVRQAETGVAEGEQ
jgi:histidinol phosphatase-like enzyme (inositol monophosphatase family)